MTILAVIVCAFGRAGSRNSRPSAPPLFETMAVLGRERTLERLASAVGRVQAATAADLSA